MATRIDLTGKRFGKWIVESYAGYSGSSAFWWCVCDCGTRIKVEGQSLRSGHSKSCGCDALRLLAQSKTKHGMCKTRVYQIWQAMLRRCDGNSEHSKRYYQARGITVCDRWHKFENFLADMGEPPDGYSIDRIDNNKGYESGNCRWATATEQVRNSRRVKTLSYAGETMTAPEWAERVGITSKTLARRLREGWTIERALTGTDQRFVYRIALLSSA